MTNAVGDQGLSFSKRWVVQGPLRNARPRARNKRPAYLAAGATVSAGNRLVQQVDDAALRDQEAPLRSDDLTTLPSPHDDRIGNAIYAICLSGYALWKLEEKSMAERSDLIRQAAELRQQAEQESNETIRSRLFRMAEHYDHLADSQGWSEAHPVTVAAIGDVFTKRE